MHSKPNSRILNILNIRQPFGLNIVGVFLLSMAISFLFLKILASQVSAKPK